MKKEIDLEVQRVNIQALLMLVRKLMHGYWTGDRLLHAMALCGTRVRDSI